MRPLGSTAASHADASARPTFDEFVSDVEPRLRVALVASFGATDGRLALVDALSWAWEHWDRVREMQNPAGYLYRVGQTAARRARNRPIPASPDLDAPFEGGQQAMSVEVAAAVARLPLQQRRAVMLVHAFGWSQRAVAELLGVTPSTIKQALDRGMRRLAHELEDHL